MTYDFHWVHHSSMSLKVSLKFPQISENKTRDGSSSYLTAKRGMVVASFLRLQLCILLCLKLYDLKLLLLPRWNGKNLKIFFFCFQGPTISQSMMVAIWNLLSRKTFKVHPVMVIIITGCWFIRILVTFKVDARISFTELLKASNFWFILTAGTLFLPKASLLDKTPCK